MLHEDYIREIVRRIAQKFDPERIILFGSHARGEERPDSDVDLLIVMNVDGTRRAKRLEIRGAIHDIPIAKDIVVATPEDVERFGDLVGAIIMPALEEGRTVYERAA